MPDPGRSFVSGFRAGSEFGNDLVALFEDRKHRKEAKGAMGAYAAQREKIMEPVHLAEAEAKRLQGIAGLPDATKAQKDLARNAQQLADQAGIHALTSLMDASAQAAAAAPGNKYLQNALTPIVQADLNAGRMMNDNLRQRSDQIFQAEQSAYEWKKRGEEADKQYGRQKELTGMGLSSRERVAKLDRQSYERIGKMRSDVTERLSKAEEAGNLITLVNAAAAKGTAPSKFDAMVHEAMGSDVFASDLIFGDEDFAMNPEIDGYIQQEKQLRQGGELDAADAVRDLIEKKKVKAREQLVQDVKDAKTADDIAEVPWLEGRLGAKMAQAMGITGWRDYVLRNSQERRRREGGGQSTMANPQGLE